MIRIFLPAFIPLIAFGIFVLWRNRRLAAGHAVPAIEGPRFWSIVATIVIAVGMLIGIGFSQSSDSDGDIYTPAQMYDDGSFSRGGVE